MARSTYAKWDPPLVGTFRFIATNTRAPKVRLRGETFTRILESHFADKRKERIAAKAAKAAKASAA